MNLNSSQTHVTIIIGDVTSLNFTLFFIFRRAVFKKYYPIWCNDIGFNDFGTVLWVGRLYSFIFIRSYREGLIWDTQQ